MRIDGVAPVPVDEAAKARRGDAGPGILEKGEAGGRLAYLDERGRERDADGRPRGDGQPLALVELVDQGDEVLFRENRGVAQQRLGDVGAVGQQRPHEAARRAAGRRDGRRKGSPHARRRVVQDDDEGLLDVAALVLAEIDLEIDPDERPHDLRPLLGVRLPQSVEKTPHEHIGPLRTCRKLQVLELMVGGKA